MQAKGMPPGDAAFKEIVADRVLIVLRRLVKRGIVAKHGTSRDSKWALANRLANVRLAAELIAIPILSRGS
jgi:hypothetical protein